MNQDSNVLALDTAFGEISAAIHTARGDFLAAMPADHGKTRSVSIIPMLDGLLSEAGLSWKELDLLSLGAGPGSFTGLRIAAATLAGINSGMNLPILHLSSLAITARQAESSDPIWVLEDARAGEAFIGHYQAEVALDEDRCLTWAEVASEIIPGLYVCHSEPQGSLTGWQRLPLTVSRAKALLAATLAEMDMANVAMLPRYPDPVYLQRSQAEKNVHV
ncbi:tRNA threonylcarbamoyladenosine biosynthesis protein TsaB [Mariprofundus ferrinatatus]|uniref:tRNA threonylcarbamoyladenosine biosynthesis protein TsaB n=1 Tax=Mariprofundus ferrinatatus TaxID=1921087 RepID=A0A2K8L9H4_9PROT|nr:tRNA (adenosine(37)-N6)-threonylcarbamoyltransferase complex dimerization subunit type 1 TsaB [Mariprofundus ferrinatatus]ATX80926.1 tRNA threonylcarbamoyladenosine biosynthesis protein TsaB [Mariprofundus ferrinatatus]